MSSSSRTLDLTTSKRTRTTSMIKASEATRKKEFFDYLELETLGTMSKAQKERRWRQEMITGENVSLISGSSRTQRGRKGTAPKKESKAITKKRNLISSFPLEELAEKNLFLKPIGPSSKIRVGDKKISIYQSDKKTIVPEILQLMKYVYKERGTVKNTFDNISNLFKTYAGVSTSSEVDDFIKTIKSPELEPDTESEPVQPVLPKSKTKTPPVQPVQPVLPKETPPILPKETPPVLPKEIQPVLPVQPVLENALVELSRETSSTALQNVENISEINEENSLITQRLGGMRLSDLLQTIGQTRSSIQYITKLYNDTKISLFDFVKAVEPFKLDYFDIIRKYGKILSKEQLKYTKATEVLAIENVQATPEEINAIVLKEPGEIILHGMSESEYITESNDTTILEYAEFIRNGTRQLLDNLPSVQTESEVGTPPIETEVDDAVDEDIPDQTTTTPETKETSTPDETDKFTGGGELKSKGSYKPIHAESLGLFFKDSTKPDWNVSLFFDREKRIDTEDDKSLKIRFLKQSRDIVAKYGLELFIPFVVFGESADISNIIKENEEIVQVFFKYKKINQSVSTSSGLPEGTVGVKLSSLKQFRDLIAKPGTTPTSETPSQTFSSGGIEFQLSDKESGYSDSKIIDYKIPNENVDFKQLFNLKKSFEMPVNVRYIPEPEFNFKIRTSV